MSKPMLVSLPLVLLLLDFWPLQRVGVRPAQASASRLLLEKVPFVFLAGVASLVTLWVQKQAGATEMLERLGWGARVGNALVAGCRYLGKLAWPSHLSVFYPHPGRWPVGWVCLAGLALLMVSLLAVRMRRRLPFVFVGWFWYLVTLLPVSGLVQVGRQSMADRYTYIPFIGLFLVIAWALPGGRPLRTIVASAAGVIAMLACAGQTWRQMGYWKDSESLFRHAIAVTKNNYVAHSNLGDALQQQGRTEEALAQYRLVLESRPDEVNARNNLGSLLLNLGRTGEALAEFREAARRAPGFAEGRNNLGYALQKAGLLDEAAAEYERAAELNPKDFRVQLNLASLSLQQGKPAEAVGHLQAALALNPDDALTRKAFGSLLFNLGRTEEAVPQFEAAVKLAPNDAEAHANLGFALGRQGNRERARTELARALALRPDYPEAQAQLRALEKN
ncbi:MAG TPA: tetratricopeptide repeat protein [Methylomirabilota bacterium]|nr:tetratricopeptide repeat protein [Methylomirabilota bacterium]